MIDTCPTCKRTYPVEGSGNSLLSYVERVAFSRLRDLLCKWLPDGRFSPDNVGYVCGDITVSLRTGFWEDIGLGVEVNVGAPVVALYAYQKMLTYAHAAEELARELGIPEDTICRIKRG